MSYRERLHADRRWAMGEGDRYFDRASQVFVTLERIARRLDAIGVPYAVVGTLAMFHHGYRRFTNEVDLLVTAGGLEAIHRRLLGDGYDRAGKRNIIDTETGVRIEFIVTGEFPGDGLPKPVTFPNPEGSSEPLGGYAVLRLPALVELKLASGTAEWRHRDKADAQEMIHVLELPEDFADEMNPLVQLFTAGNGGSCRWFPRQSDRPTPPRTGDALPWTTNSRSTSAASSTCCRTTCTAGRRSSSAS